MTRALGRYELLRPLARGGMAEVYLARRRAAGIEKWLVVKRMRPQHSRDPRFLALFVREARLSMSLVHQNIVPVFDFGRIDEEVFLAMERVEGKDLGSSLARAPTHRVPPLLAAFIAAECCQALDYAHQRKGPDGVALGIVHRDVTPRNVLLSWSGEVKLTDFGIAALAGDATQRLLGTPQYMAPEQARGEPIDPRADIYAIGLVLREVITGARPRPGDDRSAILDAARCGALLPWSHLDDPIAASEGEHALDGNGGGDRNGGRESPLPAALVAIIDRATAPDAADRYPDARSMLEELDTFIVGQRAAHKAESPARQLAAWLASVWDGARDDIEVDGTIAAEHLVSFLDDGALDVIGTGTVRSMAATAADESLLAPVVEATPPPGEDATSAATAEPPRPGEPAARLSHISSSTSTVASGSFDTIGGAIGAESRASSSTSVTRTTQLRISRLVGTAVIVIAVGAAVLLGTVSLRGPRGPLPAAGLGPSTTVPPVTRSGILESSAQQPGAQQVDSQQPGTQQPGTQQSSTQQPSTQQPGTQQPGTQEASAQPGNTQPADTQPANTRRPSTQSPSTPAPRPARRASGEREGSAGVATGASRARTPLCRVTINVTPWAYYTVDGEPKRHETPSTIELTPGPHRLHVWNPETGIERDIVIEVPADRETMNYSEPLQPPTLGNDAGLLRR